MAYTLAVSFERFYEAINLPGDHRSAANTRREWLERSLKGKLTVLDTVSFGSIPRFTALKDHADVDLLVLLHYGLHIKDRKPSAVLQTVRTALAPSATAGIRRNGQAVTLKFESWPNVDVVPASRVTDTNGVVTHYNIPNMHREEWVPTNPPEHARRISEKASQCGQNFRRLITMVKHWNRVKNSERLQSFHIEAIAIDTFSSSMTDLPWELHRFFESARTKLSFHWHAGADVSAYLDYETRQLVQAAVNSASSKATAAWSAGYQQTDHCDAIVCWRDLFGLAFPAYG